MATFCLSRATPEDIPEMIEIIGGLADDNVKLRDYALGPNTPEDRERNAKAYQKMMVQDSKQFWLKVTEKTTGKIIAGSMWMISPTVVPEVKFDNRPRPWLDAEPETRRRVMKTVEEEFEVRKQLYTQPHMQLFLIFTHREYTRRGAGSLMMQWGCDLADHLFLPIWVRGNLTGRRLYERFGFVVRQTSLTSDEFLVFLNREVKASQFEAVNH